MLPDGSGRTEQNTGKKTGEENQKKGNLKIGWGKKRTEENSMFKPPGSRHFYNTAENPLKVMSFSVCRTQPRHM
jgi:hypothetical protein